MSSYSFETQSAVAAIHSAAEERAQFLQRTYSTLFAGVLGLCVTLWAFQHVPILQQIGYALISNWILYIVAGLGITYAVHAVADRYPINLVAYAAYVVFFGIYLGPLVMIAEGTGLVTQAALLTGIVFTGLTGYVFYTGKDFSFLGGALTVGLFTLVGVGLLGWLFGFSLGIFYPAAAVLLFAGYILYDTSNILHHYPTTAYVTAAIVLFTDVVMLFKNLLILLMQAQDD